MLDKISEWIQGFHLCNLSDTNLSASLSDEPETPHTEVRYCWTTPNKLLKSKRKKNGFQYNTWYAKDYFLEYFHNAGSGLFKRPWKTVMLSAVVIRNSLFMVFVDLYTLDHKVFKSDKKRSWKSICHMMLESEQRPAKLLIENKIPLKGREFEHFTQSCGYIFSGGHTRKFLSKQLSSFGEAREMIEQIKYIIEYSSSFGDGLQTFQNCLKERPLIQDFEGIEPIKIASGKDVKIKEGSNRDEYSDKGNEGKISIQNNDNKGDMREDKRSLAYESASIRTDHDIYAVQSYSKSNVPLQKNVSYPNCKKGILKKSVSEVYTATETNNFSRPDSSSSLSEEVLSSLKMKPKYSRSNIRSISDQIRKQISVLSGKRNEEFKTKKKKEIGKISWECVLLHDMVAFNRHHYIFMDADTCYPVAVTTQNGSNKTNYHSFVKSCKRFFESFRKPKELHVINGKPYNNKNYIDFVEGERISYFTRSPFLKYLKEPRAFFSIIRRTVMVNENYLNQLILLQDLANLKIGKNRTERDKNGSKNSNPERKKVILLIIDKKGEIVVLFIDIYNKFTEAFSVESSKKPRIFPMDLIIFCEKFFTIRGIPEEIHTLDKTLFTSTELKDFMNVYNITHRVKYPKTQKRSRLFRTLAQVKSCFHRSSDVKSGLRLWRSLQKRLMKYSYSQKNTTCLSLQRDEDTDSSVKSSSRKKIKKTKKVSSKNILEEIMVEQTLSSIIPDKDVGLFDPKRDEAVVESKFQKPRYTVKTWRNNISKCKKRKKLILPTRGQKKTTRNVDIKQLEMLNEIALRMENSEDRNKKMRGAAGKLKRNKLKKRNHGGLIFLDENKIEDLNELCKQKNLSNQKS